MPGPRSRRTPVHLALLPWCLRLRSCRAARNSCLMVTGPSCRNGKFLFLGGTPRTVSCSRTLWFFGFRSVVSHLPIDSAELTYHIWHVLVYFWHLCHLKSSGSSVLKILWPDFFKAFSIFAQDMFRQSAFAQAAVWLPALEWRDAAVPWRSCPPAVGPSSVGRFDGCQNSPKLLAPISTLRGLCGAGRGPTRDGLGLHGHWPGREVFGLVGWGIKKKGGKVEAPSSGWLGTVKRTPNSIAYCFVFPRLTEQQWEVYSTRMLNAKSLALREAISLCPTPTAQDGGFFVKGREPTWEATLDRVAAYEEKVQGYEWTYEDLLEKEGWPGSACKGGAAACLATQLLMWTSSNDTLRQFGCLCRQYSGCFAT